MEAYGWFGTAYFMYDIWSMYKVHTQKIADKLKLMRLNAATTGANSSNGVNIVNDVALKTNTNGVVTGGGGGDSGDESPVRVSAQQRENDDIYDYDGECVQIPKDGKWDFFKYVITHPVMMVHHVFIGTFGLLVVTVSVLYTQFFRLSY